MKTAILCGGRGTRLLPSTEGVPKTLVPINGRPILEHILRLYASKGLRNFILCIGYKAERIREFIDGATIDRSLVSIEYSDIGESASMLARIHAVKDRVDSRLMVSYGDTLTDLDVSDFVRFHEASGSLVTIVAANIQSPFGLVSFSEDGQANTFDEKPSFHYYIGHVLLEPAAFEQMTPDLLSEPDGRGLVHFFQKLIGQGQLRVYRYSGRQITFNTHKEREEAEEMIKAFYTVDEQAAPGASGG